MDRDRTRPDLGEALRASGPISRDEGADVSPITPEQLAHIASQCEDRDLHSIWSAFDTPGGDPEFPHSLMTFTERREGFLWTVRQLFDHGYELLRDGVIPFPGPIDDKIDALRQAFPADDDGMDEGMWFFLPECPMGANWKWPNRAEPIPFLAGGESMVVLTDGHLVRRSLKAPGVGAVTQGSSQILAPAHVRYIAAALQHRVPKNDQPTLDELVAELRASMPQDVNEFTSADYSHFFHHLCPIEITWARRQLEE
ncbi:hypothetical protein [Microbacterium sp. NPDC090003]|uniref:hypothetical protein n=1 Tax=Microbacterium sp. NPDC090003 TaxID=3364203 RepID=UPI0038208A14